MRVLVAVGVAGPRRVVAALGGPDLVRVAEVPADAPRPVLDGELAGPGESLVILGSDGGIAAVVRRLMRRGTLAERPVTLVPTDPGSAVAAAFGLPADPEAAAGLAVSGRPTSLGLVRDDHGDVLLAEATMRPWSGRRVGVRAYVDDTELANHEVGSLTVRPGRSGLTARVVSRRWGRARTGEAAGRAVTVNCAPARLTLDGVDHPRAVIRRTWWYEPDRWTVHLPG